MHNYSPSFNTLAEFIAYLEDTLLPDLRKFNTLAEFIAYLEDTLLPDLRKSGSEGFVQDFEEAIYWMEMRERITDDTLPPQGQIILDRPHRFRVGEIVRHVDSTPEDASSRITIEQLTIRTVDGRAYPTYSISAYTYGQKEVIHDVLDTDDLLSSEEYWRARGFKS